MNKLIPNIIVCVGALAPFTALAIPVGLELALLTDVSGSISDSEYLLQKDGYVKAFQDADIQAAITGIEGGIAVSYYEWSGANRQTTKVNWFHIFDAASSNEFADKINGTSTRSITNGYTAPGSAIAYVIPKFGHETGGPGNGFESLRQVIDVSGDGVENAGIDTLTTRNAALAAGVDAINGLPIGGADLLNWYQANIQGGTYSFTLAANNFDDFNNVILQKIGREIIPIPETALPIPEPAFLTLLGVSLFGFAVHRSKNVAAQITRKNIPRHLA